MTVQEIRKMFGEETERIAFGSHDLFGEPSFDSDYVLWLEQKLIKELANVDDRN